MEFHIFADKVTAQFNSMTTSDMFMVDIDKSTLADNYLLAFPAGTNQIFIERTAHDCQMCRQFVKHIGTAVTINDDGTLTTIWDVEGLETPYLEVAAELSRQVREASIKSVFLHNEPKSGKKSTVQLLEDNTTRTWSHFYADIPTKFYERDLATVKGKTNSRAQVHVRSLETLSLSTLDTVLDLLTSDAIYRGAEHLSKVQGFRASKEAYEAADHKNAYAWKTYKSTGASIRNSVIGSLLIDVENGVDIESAIKSFEAKVAPANYKRPKAIVTKRMLESAIATIDEKGIRTSLTRRQALPSDVSVNDVIFADRSVGMKDQDPLMAMLDSQPTEIKGLDKAPEISMEDFISTVVPASSSISIVTSKASAANKVQISAPSDATAKNILQWSNNFSWTYSGNTTDSPIAARVKAAGGAVDGFLRCSLQWNEDNADKSNDLDLHCKTPTGHIYYGRKESYGGVLDIDITDPRSQCVAAGGTAVENITWPSQGDLQDGMYDFYINNYSGSNSKGFRAEIAIGDTLYNYDYPAKLHDNIHIADVIVRNGEVTISHHLTHVTANSGELVPVKMMMLSPNYWGENNSGNKHYIFITGEEQEKIPFRGHFNEYLSSEYHEIRKPLNMLASKMMCEPVENGLHGYGFSSTKRSHVFVKADHKLFKVMV